MKLLGALFVLAELAFSQNDTAEDSSVEGEDDIAYFAFKIQDPKV